MTDAATNVPPPSLARLVKATVVAVGLAAVLFVLVVLPAEFNRDPTGFGRAVGLTVLSAPAPENATAPSADGAAASENETVVEVPPGKGLEYKFRIRAGAKMKYAWRAAEGEIFYDFHGEPAGDATGFFESYAVGKAVTVKGTLTAPFDGVHGWYWKNSGAVPAKITLTTSGTYEVLGVR